MINHTNCDHPATSSARAKCRRAVANGGEAPKATPKEVDLSKGSGGAKGQTPRDRDKQCMICGVERIDRRGTPALEGYMLYVGPKCAYMLNSAPDIEPVD